MRFRLVGYPDEFEVELTASAEGFQARINGGEEIAGVIQPTAAAGEVVRIGNRATRVFSARQRGSILVSAGPTQLEFIPVETGSARRMHGLATPEVIAPMPGKVVKVAVTEGQQVAAGDVLVVLEAMKMETALQAESAALVKEIRTFVGQMVDHGMVLLVLSPAPSPAASAGETPGR